MLGWGWLVVAELLEMCWSVGDDRSAAESAQDLVTLQPAPAATIGKMTCWKQGTHKTVTVDTDRVMPHSGHCSTLSLNIGTLVTTLWTILKF